MNSSGGAASGPSRGVPRVRFAGDAMLLVELGDRIDPAINARAVALAEAIVADRLRGVRDVQVTFCSVAVAFDPLTCNGDRLAGEMEDRAGRVAAGDIAPGDIAPGAAIEVPVRYGGEFGPDLADVARHAGCAEETVIERHVGRDYRVYMIGFLPGFPYMAEVDPAIAMPRLATPRVRVPAGSVAIAGRMAGIYPREAPGGWRLIGRTDLELFDRRRERPALLRPGDTVRFTPLSADRPPAARPRDRHPRAS